MTTQRPHNQLRPITFERHVNAYAEGSVLVRFGKTHVLCTASVEHQVPRFLRDKKQGWVTAEYGMLPRSTHSRMQREASRGKQSGRTQEIQRLIGRSLRTCIDLQALGERTITLDCDVIQADGGTRTAAISGACVALCDAVTHLQKQGLLTTNPIKQRVAAVSVGVFEGKAVLDLDYRLDSQADTDMNLVMTQDGRFIEIQGTAEGEPFDADMLQQLLALGKQGIDSILSMQAQVLA